MKETIIDLYKFQIFYLERLLKNIPDKRLYERQSEGYNSPGWILGHICVEADDVLVHLNIPHEKLDLNWYKWFKNTSGRINSAEVELPSKTILLKALIERYSLLSEKYFHLTNEERLSAHPSIMLKEIFPNLDSWFAHHLTTHIGIHCGNISVWKKIVGLDVNGF